MGCLDFCPLGWNWIGNSIGGGAVGLEVNLDVVSSNPYLSMSLSFISELVVSIWLVPIHGLQYFILGWCDS